MTVVRAMRTTSALLKAVSGSYVSKPHARDEDSSRKRLKQMSPRLLCRCARGRDARGATSTMMAPPEMPDSRRQTKNQLTESGYAQAKKAAVTITISMRNALRFDS